MWTHFVATKLQPVLRFDAQIGTRPMTYYVCFHNNNFLQTKQFFLQFKILIFNQVDSPDAVANLFDNIAYSKGEPFKKMYSFYIFIAEKSSNQIKRLILIKFECLTK